MSLYTAASIAIRRTKAGMTQAELCAKVNALRKQRDHDRQHKYEQALAYMRDPDPMVWEVNEQFFDDLATKDPATIEDWLHNWRFKNGRIKMITQSHLSKIEHGDMVPHPLLLDDINAVLTPR